MLNTIHHIFHTFTAGWRPESNRASFLMMLPTPGMTAWSRRTSQSILLLWLFTASSQWEKLNLREHTSRLSIALTLSSQSSVNLQTVYYWKNFKNIWQLLLQLCHKVVSALMRLYVSKLFLSYIQFVCLLWNKTALVNFSVSRNKCLSSTKQRPYSHWTGQVLSHKACVFHATAATVFRHRLM